jgi:hypothetical protein
LAAKAHGRQVQNRKFSAVWRSWRPAQAEEGASTNPTGAVIRRRAFGLFATHVRGTHEIVQAIRAGKLQYRHSAMHGNPFLRLLRREVEALVKKEHGGTFLKDQKFFFKQWGGKNKKKAGRLLDGRTWDEMPTAPESARAPRSARARALPVVA